VARVEHVAEHLERRVVLPGEQFRPQAAQALRVVEFVAVHAENPGRRSGKPGDHVVRFRGVRHHVVLDLRVLRRQAPQNRDGPVGGLVVSNVTPITEVADVPDDLFDEQVLVLDEHDRDNPGSGHRSR